MYEVKVLSKSDPIIWHWIHVLQTRSNKKKVTIPFQLGYKRIGERQFRKTMSGYRSLPAPPITQTSSTSPAVVASSASASPSPIPVNHLQHPSNRNIGPIYHPPISMGNAHSHIGYSPATSHPMHGPTINMQQHHHQQQQPHHPHVLPHHHPHHHHQLMARHHLVGHSTRHNNMLHHHSSGGTGGNGGGINMTTTIMPLNASK